MGQKAEKKRDENFEWERGEEEKKANHVINVSAMT